MATTHDNPAVSASVFSAEEQHDRENARRLAQRYRVPFIDLREQRIDPELFRTIPADLMFRYNFVPLEQQNNVLAIVGRGSCRLCIHLRRLGGVPKIF